MKAAIFDMDGTLVDSLILWDVIWKEFGHRFLGGETFNPSREDRDKVPACTLKDAMGIIHAHYRLGNSVQDLLETAKEVIHHFYENDVELKPGVKEFLEYCSQKGIYMCVLSSTEPSLIDIALKHCEIDKYFSDIFSCVVLGKGKENPEVFRELCAGCGVEVTEAWLFEDSATALETAKGIGMQTVGVYDSHRGHQEKVENASTIYIGKDETLMKLTGDVV